MLHARGPRPKTAVKQMVLLHAQRTRTVKHQLFYKRYATTTIFTKFLENRINKRQLLISCLTFPAKACTTYNIYKIVCTSWANNIQKQYFHQVFCNRRANTHFFYKVFCNRVCKTTMFIRLSAKTCKHNNIYKVF